jgi:peroxiredoxin
MSKKMFFISLYVIAIVFLALIFYPGFSSGVTNAATTSKIENFTLADIYGNKQSLKDYGDAKAIVVIFIATQCPVSNAYNTRMVDLYNKYHDKNITILGINSNKSEDIEECKEHAEEHGFKFPILKDKGNIIADMFEAGHTPEAYVLNPKTFEVLYHGRIDDSRDINNVESKDLSNALNEILGSKKISVAETKAFGCSIKRI